MRNFFKKLSGEPKDGDIIECIKPVTASIQIIFSISLMLLAMKYDNILAGIMSLLFSWQIGWGMSIKRFYKNEEK